LPPGTRLIICLPRRYGGRGEALSAAAAVTGLSLSGRCSTLLLLLLLPQNSNSQLHLRLRGVVALGEVFEAFQSFHGGLAPG